MATEVYFALAGPQAFGDWKIIGSQINGPMTYRISASAMGNARVFGEVRYWNADGQLVVEPFYEYTEIATDNSTQNIRARFRSAAPASTEVRIVVTSFPRTEMPSRRAGSRSVGTPSREQ